MRRSMIERAWSASLLQMTVGPQRERRVVMAEVAGQLGDARTVG
jgi:hypothetical protein